MNTQAYQKLCDIIYRQSGISLREGKETMLASRIASRIKALALQDERDYVAYLEKSMDQEIGHLLDAVSTNVTSFFRESAHFDILRDVMQGWLKQGQTRFKVWSAAASSGEEPYTLAMVMRDVCKGATAATDVRILGTDINNQVLAKAQAGEYPVKLLERIPTHLRKAYLSPVAGTNGARERIKPELKSMMMYRRLNLSTPPYPMKGPMDVIFCRNVMIYFDEPMRERMIREFHRLLRPGGYLFVGHSEGIRKSKGMFTSTASSVYKKNA